MRCIMNAHVDMTDPTWSLITVAICSMVEVNVGICCACLPIVYPFFRLLVGKRMMSTAAASLNHNASSDPGTHTISSNNNSRLQRKLDGYDSDTEYLWSGHASPALNGTTTDVPMDGIMVTHNVSINSV